MQVDDLEESRAYQDWFEVINAARRHAERMAAYKAWSSPEAMEARRVIEQEAADKALAAGKELARDLEEIPIPDPLPTYLWGQPKSTIQAFLRHEREGKL